MVRGDRKPFGVMPEDAPIDEAPLLQPAMMAPAAIRKTADRVGVEIFTSTKLLLSSR
jgi:hypothetical protein